MDVSVIHPAFCGFSISGELLKQRALCSKKQGCYTLQRVDLARPFLVSPAIVLNTLNSILPGLVAQFRTAQQVK